MKEKKFTHAKDRDGIVYVSGSINGARYRLSTGKVATSANMKWVDTNWRSCIESLLDNSTKQKVGKDETVLLHDYGQKSLDANSGTRKELTVKEYQQIFDTRITPIFGDKPIDTILTSDLKKWQSDMINEGLSSSRVRNVRTVLNGILVDAVNDKLISENPFKGIKLPRKDHVEIYPFTLDEVNMLINKADGWFKNMLSLAFFTGMRTGEIMALRWEDIDFTNNTIIIRRAIRAGQLGDCKTVSSRREIDMLPRAKEALKAQRLITGLKNKEIFLNRVGDGFAHSSALSDTYWHRLCQKCELFKRDFYNTRHTFATMMVSHGEDVLWVANMLGHKDATMVMTKYAKYRRDNRIKRAAFLDVTVPETPVKKVSNDF